MTSLPPLVLIHGAGGNAATWSSVLPTFGTARVHAVDLPGRGSSDVPAVDSAAAAVAPALSSAPDGALLVGHSYGGAVAIEAALAEPERWAGLVLVSSGARLKVAPQILQQVAVATADAPFRLDFAFGEATPRAVIEDYARTSSHTPPPTTLADWRACDGFDQRSRLGALKLPVLVVYGSEDRLTPGRFQEKLVAALPSGRSVVVDGAGHMLPWEAPGAFVAAIRAWWA